MHYFIFPISTRCFMRAVLVLLSVLAAQPAFAQHVEKEKLLPSDGDSMDMFGDRLDISGEFAMIGATGDDDLGSGSGSVYVFRYDPIGDQWKEDAKLLSSSGGANHHFGTALCMSGDLALIGEGQGDYLGVDSGTAYIFRYDPITGTWIEEAQLGPSSGDPGDGFGYSVCLEGDVALVGAIYDDDLATDAGAAYLFRRDPISNIWSEEAKILPSSGGAKYYFGAGLAVSGDAALIGCYNEGSSASGAAYVFRHDPISKTWSQEARLVPKHSNAGAWFGLSLDLDMAGEIAVIAAQRDDDLGTEAGAVHVFRYDHGYKTWLEDTKLVASDGSEWDRFGSAVLLSGNDLLVGAYGDDDNGECSGSTYVLYYDSNSRSWRERGKLLAGDGMTYDQFGSAIALSGDTALVGAPRKDDPGLDSGSAYVFDLFFPGHFDVKCNGQEQNVIVNSSEKVTLTIDVQARDQKGEPVDVWVIGYSLSSGWNFSYGYFGQPGWNYGLGNVYFSGGLADVSETVLDMPLGAGIYNAYLIVDGVADCILSPGDLVGIDVVTFVVN